MIKKQLLIPFFFLMASISYSQNTYNDEYDKCGYDLKQENELLDILGTSWGYNYDSLLADIVIWEANEFVQQMSIGQSVQGREMYELTITDFTIAKSIKHRIFIHARTHPNEVQAFWVTDEIINYLTSNSTLGVYLREHCIFHIIPMYNPDGVELEYSRYNADSIDIESNWGEPVPAIEVLNLKSRLLNLMLETNPIEIALNMHSAYQCNRYFVYHHENGTSVNFAAQEEFFIESVRSHYYDGIKPYNHYVSWTSGTPTQYPESWWWNSYQEQVMALTYEDMNCASAGNYQKTAFAILHGISDYLGLGFQDIDNNFTDNTFEINVYPNPTTGIISVEAEDIERIDILDITGRTILKHFRKSGNLKGIVDTRLHGHDIDLSQQQKGIYFVRVTTNKGVKVGRVILE